MRSTKRVVTDEMWARIEPHLPVHQPSPQGGRPRRHDRDCLEGVLWMARTGAAWQEMPVDLPSGSTCWRRLQEWAGEESFAALHAALVRDLAAVGKLDLSQLIADATFVRCKGGGDRVGNTKAAKGMKLEVVADNSGLPLGLATAAASTAEVDLVEPALATVPVDVPAGTPLLLDKGYDSDPLRDRLEEAGYLPLAPHRANRTKPSRNDGRRMKRYRQRYKIERTNAWLHCYRALASRWSYYSFMYVGLAYLVFSHIALRRF